MTDQIWDRNYSEGIVSAWTSNRLVLQYIFRGISGGVDAFWLNWAFESLLRRRFKRGLSIGCGDGGHELLIARAGYVETIDAFDASQAGVDKARSIAKQEHLNCNFEVDTFEAFVARPAPSGRYDFIMFAGSLHHVRDLEGMCAKAHALLSDDGVVLINEYIGPRHAIYPPARLAVINAFLQAIAPEFKRRDSLTPATIEGVRVYDPSEAVRSDLIPAYLQIFFSPEYEADFGGALLHPLFDCLDGARINDESPESDSIVRLLIEADRALTKQFGSDFRFGVYSKREIV